MDVSMLELEQADWSASKMYIASRVHTDVFRIFKDGKDTEFLIKGWDFTNEVTTVLNENNNLSFEDAVAKARIRFKKRELES